MGLADRISLNPDRPSQSTAVVGLTFLSVALSLGVSAPLLTVLGIPYDAPYGSFVFKIHPGTYVLAAAFALALVERGNPLAELGRSLAHQPAVAFYLLADALVTGFSVARHGFSGAAFFVDSQLAPGVLALLLARLDLATLRRLFVLIVAFLALNATLGVAEQLLQARLIPLTVAGGQDLGEEVFRATALTGHPLSGAIITGLALFAFWSLADPRARIALCWLAVMALLSFGGRTSLALSLALFGVLLAATGLRALRQGRLSYRAVTGGAALVALLFGAVLLAVTFGGVGERILGNLAWDRSAEVREVSLTVYRFLRPEQLLLGVGPEEIGSLIRRLGLDYPYETIENFWIVLSLQLGFPFSVLFAAGFLILLLHLARISAAPLRLALLGFILAASTNNSLSAKTTVLSVVVAITYGCVAYRLGRRRSRSDMEASLDRRLTERTHSSTQPGSAKGTPTMKRCTLAVLLILGTAEASAGSIYVAPNGVNGGTGPIGAPLASLQLAINNANPGDTIYLRGGDYFFGNAPIVPPTKNGLQNSRIIIRAYQTEVPNLKDSNGCLTIKGNWVEVRGLTCYNSLGDGIRIEGGSNVSVISNKLIGVDYGGITSFKTATRPATDNLIEGNEVGYAMRDNMPSRRCTNRDGTPRNPCAYQGGGWSTGVGADDAGAIIRNNYVHHVWGEGIGVRGDNSEVSGNWVENVFAGSIYVDGAKNVVIERNFVLEWGDPQFLRQIGTNLWGPDGIKLADEVRPTGEEPLKNIKIHNNIVVGASTGIAYVNWRDPAPSVQGPSVGMLDTRIVHNTIVDATRYALFLDPAGSGRAHQNTILEGNIFYRADSGPLKSEWEVTGLTFRRNSWFTNSGSAGQASHVNDITTAPLLRGGAKEDPASYKPTTSSPLINKAEAGLAPTNDYAYGPRLLGSAPLGISA